MYLSIGWFKELDYSTRTLRESYEILLKKEVKQVNTERPISNKSKMYP